ncbi:uncharacterized protein Z518_07182 [Rhinocladiella mackenziei CBS 650.93]|uniref:6-phosphogluconolactonase n=1 Tax=Rhinocladiella mackenziei CBS 650.93 TaxID=1442369 RepID=A0A0D2ICP4_9EURO|nr:uncharacterized protein Z518_07182 [Rhinocladiella mackenziei CBS 650.93]KIX03629.1 hypothetical protein Z518_07182 [Rhinocladiella mackenziei CBS 650.93]
MKLLIILLAASATLVAPSMAAKEKASFTFYVALQSTGILEVSFDPNKDVNESLSIIATNTNAGKMPGWLTSYHHKIYSISRTAFPDNDTKSGGVFAFQEPPASAARGTLLTFLDKESSNGDGGVYCDVNRDGKTLAAANIDGSTVSIYPLSEDGTIGKATYVFKYNLTEPSPGTRDSQVKANPHQSIFDPSGQFLFVPCRGADRVYVYSVQGPEQVKEIESITLPPGTGPRHVVFKQLNATTADMYLISELDNTVRLFTLNYENPWGPRFPQEAGNLTITLKQTISTLGPDLPPSLPDNRDLAAEIAVTHDGKFAYASNRNTLSLDSDNLAIYSVHDNRLTYLGSNETQGKIPRHFALSKDQDNQWLAVANQLTQDIVVFERDLKAGLMKDVKGRLKLGELDMTLALGPMCILWK